MNTIAAIANLSWLASGQPASVRFRRALHRPSEVQRQLLRDYLKQNSDTKFGRSYRFEEIKSYEEFARRIPLNDYDGFKPWIDRIQAGEKHVLTAEPVTHLVPTSGSSGTHKLIPFTASLQREFNCAISAWITDLYCRRPAVAMGAAYWSISPVIQAENTETSAIPIGFEDDSVYLGGVGKRLVDAVMAVPSEVRLISDIEIFRYVSLLCLLRRSDLRLISVWHPSFLTLLLDKLPAHWENLLFDVARGDCRYANRLSSTVLRALKLKPLPQRVRQLARANPFEPETIWPSLKVVSCWGDGHAKLAKAELERRFPSVSVQSKGLIATECFVTIPFADAHPLAVTSHFFEFIDEQGRIFLADELRENEIYEVVVTTGGGLWRYRLQDQVQVTGYLGKTPSLRFLGRAGNVSDRCGEKLSEHFVAQTVHKVTADLRSLPQFAMLAPDSNGPDNHYTLYIEGDVTSQMDERLEKFLCENIHYAWCRKLGQLQAPRIFRIQKAGYETFVSRLQSDGKRIGEIKPCALSKENGWSQCFHGSYVIH